MINLFEMVQTKWSTRNKQYYIDKGYEFTSYGDELWVCIGDLPNNSNIRVPVSCDCEECKSSEIMTPYRNYNRIIQENGVYRCKSCVIVNNHNESLRKKNKTPEYYKIFIDKCTENNCIPITSPEEYIRLSTNMKYICPLHGETETVMYRIIYNNAWCYKCGKMHMTEHHRLSPEEVKERVEKKNNNTLLNPEEYINNLTKNLKVICGTCHQIFLTSLSAIANGDGRCSSCGCLVASDLARTTKEQMIEMATIGNEVMVINPGDYINMDTGLVFKCIKCGDTFSTTPRKYIKGGYQRCSHCKLSSKGEQIIREVLDKYHVNYIPQMRYADCKDKKPLPFDFYLTDYNYLIEFNGEQHYRPIEYFGGEQRFKYIQQHDNIKKQFALESDINLLVISYLDQNNIEKILVDTFKFKQL